MSIAPIQDEGVRIAYDKLLRRGLITPAQASHELRFEPGLNPALRPPADRGEWHNWTQAERDDYRGYTDAEARQHDAKQQALLPIAASMGRAVARGALSLQRATALLRAMHPDCPAGLSTTAGSHLHRAARQHEADRSAAESRVRRAVWPMIEARQPPDEVRVATLAVASPLRPWEVLLICRDVAVRTVKRRRHAG